MNSCKTSVTESWINMKNILYIYIFIDLDYFIYSIFFENTNICYALLFLKGKRQSGLDTLVHSMWHVYICSCSKTGKKSDIFQNQKCNLCISKSKLLVNMFVYSSDESQICPQPFGVSFNPCSRSVWSAVGFIINTCTTTVLLLC